MNNKRYNNENFQDKRRNDYSRRRYERNVNKYLGKRERCYPYKYTRHESQPNTSKMNNIGVILTPFEEKIENLLKAVKNQYGIAGKLIFMENEERDVINNNATVLLQNTLSAMNMVALNVNFNEKDDIYELKINDEKLAETKTILGKQMAKHVLSEMAVNEFKDKCFWLIKKKNYEEVKTSEERAENAVKEETSMEGTKAHLMMLKMGWKGKGLGVEEQGEEKPVSDTLITTITRNGLGQSKTLNIHVEVTKILEDFVRSTKMSTLVFDSSFMKEERAEIHQMAHRLNLKSKSEGKDENRRITISKKINRWDLVKELLKCDRLENESFKLIVPGKFQNLWQD